MKRSRFEQFFPGFSGCEFWRPYFGRTFGAGLRLAGRLLSRWESRPVPCVRYDNSPGEAGAVERVGTSPSGDAGLAFAGSE